MRTLLAKSVELDKVVTVGTHVGNRIADDQKFNQTGLYQCPDQIWIDIVYIK